jgi:hypothetical protein
MPTTYDGLVSTIPRKRRRRGVLHQVQQHHRYDEQHGSRGGRSVMFHIITMIVIMLYTCQYIPMTVDGYGMAWSYSVAQTGQQSILNNSDPSTANGNDFGYIQSLLFSFHFTSLLHLT